MEYIVTRAQLAKLQETIKVQTDVTRIQLQGMRDALGDVWRRVGRLQWTVEQDWRWQGQGEGEGMLAVWTPGRGSHFVPGEAGVGCEDGVRGAESVQRSGYGHSDGVFWVEDTPAAQHANSFISTAGVAGVELPHSGHRSAHDALSAASLPDGLSNQQDPFTVMNATIPLSEPRLGGGTFLHVLRRRLDDVGTGLGPRVAVPRHAPSTVDSPNSTAREGVRRVYSRESLMALREMALVRGPEG